MSTSHSETMTLPKSSHSRDRRHRSLSLALPRLPRDDRAAGGRIVAPSSRSREMPRRAGSQRSSNSAHSDSFGELNAFLPSADAASMESSEVLPLYGLLPQFYDERQCHQSSSVRYLSESDRAQCRLHCSRDGLLVTVCGKPLSPHQEPREFLYVLTEGGSIHCCSSTDDRGLHHSSLVAGAHVAAAGQITVCNGCLLTLSNESGHYAPPPSTLRTMIGVLARLGLAGIDRVQLNVIRREAYDLPAVHNRAHALKGNALSGGSWHPSDQLPHNSKAQGAPAVPAASWQRALSSPSRQCISGIAAQTCLGVFSGPGQHISAIASQPSHLTRRRSSVAPKAASVGGERGSVAPKAASVGSECGRKRGRKRGGTLVSERRSTAGAGFIEKQAAIVLCETMDLGEEESGLEAERPPRVSVSVALRALALRWGRSSMWLLIPLWVAASCAGIPIRGAWLAPVFTLVMSVGVIGSGIALTANRHFTDWADGQPNSEKAIGLCCCVASTFQSAHRYMHSQGVVASLGYWDAQERLRVAAAVLTTVTIYATTFLVLRRDQGRRGLQPWQAYRLTQTLCSFVGLGCCFALRIFVGPDAACPPLSIPFAPAVLCWCAIIGINALCTPNMRRWCMECMIVVSLDEGIDLGQARKDRGELDSELTGTNDEASSSLVARRQVTRAASCDAHT